MELRRYEELGAFLKIFQPIYARRLEKTRLERMRFAYYTSAVSYTHLTLPTILLV